MGAGSKATNRMRMQLLQLRKTQRVSPEAHRKTSLVSLEAFQKHFPDCVTDVEMMCVLKTPEQNKSQKCCVLWHLCRIDNAAMQSMLGRGGATTSCPLAGCIYCASQKTICLGCLCLLPARASTFCFCEALKHLSGHTQCTKVTFFKFVDRGAGSKHAGSAD